MAVEVSRMKRFLEGTEGEIVGSAIHRRANKGSINIME